jgi:Domain of unknown function (DUF5916)
MLVPLFLAATLAASPAVIFDQPSARPVEPAVYVGRERNIHVRPPRLDADPAVDGRLSEPEWARAAVLTGFSQFAPSDGIPAADSTQVLVWYSATAIHFGVRAFEAHGAVKPNLADRDHIGAEDRVEILLGTFNDGRQALDFQVNPLGVQADGTLVEQGSQNGNGATNAVGRTLPDLSADFVFQSRGRVTEYGYEVEVRIPFKSLKYQSSDVQSWGLSLVRHVQHSGYDDSWTPAQRSAASFLAQGGTLDGLTDLRRGLVLDLNPELTQTATGLPTDKGFDYASRRPSLGGNVRWGVTNNLTLNGTVKPDFSQVESDEGQLSFDPRNALYFAERRPFFLDGIEQFAVPSNLVYTRQIVQPEAAVKLTGKVRGTSVALLSAVDDRLSSRRVEDPTRPLFNILRVQRDVGPGSRIGLLYTDKEDGPGYNRVVGVDGRAVFRTIYSVVAQVAASTTQNPNGGGRLDGPLWGTRVERGGRRFGTTLQLSGIDPDFRTQSGFVSRPGITNGDAMQRFTHLGRNGSRFENVTGSVGYRTTWQYRTFTRRGDAQDKKLHFDLGTQLRGGWTASAGFYVETFGYDPTFYGNRRVLLPTTGDTVPFVGQSDITNHDYLVSVNTPQWSHLSASLFYLWGEDENFFEWASADIGFTTLSVDWRPTTQLRVSGEYQRQGYWRRTDGSTVGLTQIPRVKIEYQVSRPIFVRLVTEYVADRTDALRDDAGSGGALLFPDGAGGYTTQGPTASKRLRLQALFSYQPMPGTVFFAGYGSLLDEPRALRFTNLARESDGFFVKLSYLFRAR